MAKSMHNLCLDTTKWMVVTRYHALTATGYFEIVNRTLTKKEAEVWARNHHGKFWRRNFQVVRSNTVGQIGTFKGHN